MKARQNFPFLHLEGIQKKKCHSVQLVALSISTQLFYCQSITKNQDLHLRALQIAVVSTALHSPFHVGAVHQPHFILT